MGWHDRNVVMTLIQQGVCIMPTNVPALVFGPNGIIIPSDSSVLAGTLADINAAFGGSLNMNLSTPQGQLATTLAAIIADKNTQLLTLANNFDPAFSSGRMQDALARIYFIDRISARSTLVTAQCLGSSGTVIPAGTYAVDVASNLYISLTTVTIPLSGTIDNIFAAVHPGPTACPPGALNAPYKTIIGWDRISNAADGVLGRNVETPTEFELRRSQSVAVNASGSMPSIKAAVIALDRVTDCYAIDNDTGAAILRGVTPINANSIYVVVVGGNDNDVAKAIWRKKGPGASYSGNTTVTVYDDSSYYVPPLPAYAITFARPALIGIYMTVTIVENAAVPNDAAAQIQEVIIKAFAGSDGGTRATIGSLLLASRYYAGILLLGSWCEIINIKLGTTATDYNDNLQMDISQMPVIAATNIVVVVEATPT